jgi:hypothetical protein
MRQQASGQDRGDWPLNSTVAVLQIEATDHH